MNALINTLGILAVIPLLISACVGQTVHTQPAEANNEIAISYQVVLGKTLSDKDVTDFIAGNNCLPALAYQLCKDAGMVLWTNEDLIIKLSIYIPAMRMASVVFVVSCHMGRPFTTRSHALLGHVQEFEYDRDLQLSRCGRGRLYLCCRPQLVT